MSNENIFLVLVLLPVQKMSIISYGILRTEMSDIDEAVKRFLKFWFSRSATLMGSFLSRTTLGHLMAWNTNS